MRITLAFEEHNYIKLFIIFDDYYHQIVRYIILRKSISSGFISFFCQSCTNEMRHFPIKKSVDSCLLIPVRKLCEPTNNVFIYTRVQTNPRFPKQAFIAFSLINILHDNNTASILSKMLSCFLFMQKAILIQQFIFKKKCKSISIWYHTKIDVKKKLTRDCHATQIRLSCHQLVTN